MSAMDELFDKVWYNRHMNMMYHLDNGDIEVVPAGTKRYGNDVIHEDILGQAEIAAQRVRINMKILGLGATLNGGCSMGSSLPYDGSWGMSGTCSTRK